MVFQSKFEPKFERVLTAQERLIYQHYFSQQVLDVARVIEGRTPFWLLKSMAGVVLGHRIYFRKYAYQASKLIGVELLGHELMHVAQYLQGMSILKYIWASRCGYRKNRYEIEAYQQGATIKTAYIQSKYHQSQLSIKDSLNKHFSI